jgi:hypothetical protein
VVDVVDVVAAAAVAVAVDVVVPWWWLMYAKVSVMRMLTCVQCHVMCAGHAGVWALCSRRVVAS